MKAVLLVVGASVCRHLAEPVQLFASATICQCNEELVFFFFAVSFTQQRNDDNAEPNEN